MSVLFSKCLELGKIMEGCQANPYLKKITFSYSVHENPEVNKHNECFHHADELIDAFQIFSYHHLYSHFKYLASFP